MSKEKIIKVGVDAKDGIKEVDKLKKGIKDMDQSALDATNNFGAFGVTVGGLRGLFTGAMKTAKMMFSSIKIGLISTGIGAFVVALGTMAQYFRDNEEGASKFREITSQIGVVIGNVTDIVSDFGGALVKLFTRDFKGFKDGINDAIDGVKNFGKTTREEMQMAKDLEKERAELIIFEREANVSKAKSEAEIMKLRMKARDEEAFTNEQRLAFMREANKLADEQLQKDLHIAEMKLKHQQIENSYSKSSTENLNAEADLEVQLFNIQRSNFSERKRMKSEEQAIVKRIAAESQKEAKEEEARLKKEADRIKKQRETEQAEAEKKAAELKKQKDAELEVLRLAGLNEEELALDQARQKFEKLLALAEKYGQDTTFLTEQYNQQVAEIQAQYDEEEIAKAKEKEDEKLAMRQEAGNMALEAGQQIFGALNDIAQAELTAEKNSLKKQLDAGKISQEQFDKQTAKIEERALKRRKKKALLDILISTAQGVAGAIKAGAAMPFPLNLAAIATGVASVLAGIASAKAVLSEVPGESGGGGGEPSVDQGGGGEEASPSQIGGDLIPNMENIQPTLGGNDASGSSTVQAFVVETDISNSQALQQELDLQSTL